MVIDGIGTFTPETPEEQRSWSRVKTFVSQQPGAFSRDASIGGHVTGSAFVLSPDRRAVLLTHHRKLNRWLQLGGHCDGIADVPFVALKEAYEESGLSRIGFIQRAVLDVDIHTIPARGAEPEHLHYDIRYLLQAETGEIAASAESHALAWVPLAELESVTDAPSILRMRDKVLRRA